MLLCLDSYLEKSPCLPQLEWLSSHCVLGVTTWEWEEDSPPFMPPPLPPSWFHKTVTTTDCASSLVTLKWVSPTKCYIRTEPSLLLHPSLARGYFVIFHIGTELAHLLWSFNYSHQNCLQFSPPRGWQGSSLSRLVLSYVKSGLVQWENCCILFSHSGRGP